MKFRERPVVVEAEQWFPGKYVRGVQEMVYDPGDGSTKSCGYGMVVPSHGEPTKVDPGDWIIGEPDGIHHCHCKPDIFEKTYEKVED